MWTLMKLIAVALAGLAVLDLSAAEVRAQFMRQGTLPVYSSGVSPNAPFYNPLMPLARAGPGTSMQQAMFNAVAPPAAASRLPPWEFGYNPYPAPAMPGGTPAYNPSGSGGYGMVNPYAGAYGGYGMANPYGGGYGGYAAAANPYGQGGAAVARQSYQTPASSRADLSTVLTAYGIPNDRGKLRWPLAFRLMDPDESQEMRQPLEALLRLAAAASMRGAVAPEAIKAADKAAGRLRRWLRDQQVGMAEGTYRDADRFLRHVEQALKALSAY
jgi:hypothetical protein